MIFCLFLLKEEKEEDGAACGGAVVMDRGFIYSLSVFSLNSKINIVVTDRGLVNPSVFYVVEKYLLFGK